MAHRMAELVDNTNGIYQLKLNVWCLSVSAYVRVSRCLCVCVWVCVCA